MRRCDPPLTRLGLCCGCKLREDQTLYPVNPDRWRCAVCYKAETGSWHWKTPATVIEDARAS